MLYLKADLIKGEVGRGESAGGKYAARLQIGVEKDGSPMYKYFKTREEYDKYLANKNKSDSDKDKPGSNIERKVKEEHTQSSNKVKESVGKKNLFTNDGKDDDKKDKKKVEKSLRLFVRI